MQSRRYFKEIVYWLYQSVARGRRFYQSFSNSCSWRWRISILSCSFSSGEKAIPRGFNSFTAVIRACLDEEVRQAGESIAPGSAFGNPPAKDSAPGNRQSDDNHRSDQCETSPRSSTGTICTREAGRVSPP